LQIIIVTIHGDIDVAKKLQFRDKVERLAENAVCCLKSWRNIMQNLNGLTVMVTRPHPQGEILCDQIREAGGRAVYFPTIEIKPPNDFAAFAQGIANLNKYDWIIFVSPQAVYQSMQTIQKYWPQFPANIKIAALGGGTADALYQAKLPVDVSPTDEWGSEGLLEGPDFQQLAGKKIAVVSGENGRKLLAETLTVRGAQLTNIIAYQRCLPQVDVKEYIRLLQANAIDIILCTSGEILYNLKTLLESAWVNLRSVSIVVISERMQMLAKQLDFEKVLLAKNASYHALLAILKDYVCQMKK
jgi:uroporphyrinogen-III synthase